MRWSWNVSTSNVRKIVSTGARRLEFIPPMEPKLVAKPPGGEDWIHEIKLDGYRSRPNVGQGGEAFS